MLFGCGTVLATAQGKSLIRIERQRCEGCPGSCMRFNKEDEPEIWFNGVLQVGTRVGIESSSLTLTIGTLVTLGLPLVGVISVASATSSWMWSLAGGLIAVGLAITVTRSRLFNSFLTPRIRVLE